MYILRMPQIQLFCDFIFEDHRISFCGHCYEINFRGLNFRGSHVIHENSEIYVPRKFVRVWYVHGYFMYVRMYVCFLYIDHYSLHDHYSKIPLVSYSDQCTRHSKLRPGDHVILYVTILCTVMINNCSSYIVSILSVRVM